MKMKKKPETLEQVLVTLEQVTVTLDELAEATHMGFTGVQQELVTQASKQDLTDLKKSIHLDIARLSTGLNKTDENISYLRLKVDDVHEELREFTSDVRDELSGRITVLEKKRA